MQWGVGRAAGFSRSVRLRVVHFSLALLLALGVCIPTDSGLQVPRAVADPSADSFFPDLNRTDLFGDYNVTATLDDVQKQAGEQAESERASDDKKQEQGGEEDSHQKEQEPPTPTPTATEEEQEEEPSAPADSLEAALESIRNPKSNEEALKHLQGDQRRKMEEAIAAAQKENRQLDLWSNKRIDTPQFEAEYSRLEQNIVKAINEGKMTRADGLQALSMARLGSRIYTAGGDFLDFKGVPTNWDPGRPLQNLQGGPVVPGHWLRDHQARATGLLRNMNELLTSERATPTLGQLTRYNVVEQMGLSFMDFTSIRQGNQGTCWTCSAEAQAWAWRPDMTSSAINQLLFDQKFVSPFTRLRDGSFYTYDYTINDLKPNNSNLGFNINQPGQGEQSYTNMLMQRLIGNVGGNSAPWNGGNPARASAALRTIVDLSGVPTQHSVGGIPGLINATQQGLVRAAQYIPFSGHSATNSGRVMPTTDGGYLGFGINDNSWGQSGERVFVAKPENAGLYKFPGGMGSRFPGQGAGALATSMLSSLLSGLNPPPGISPQQAQQQQQARDAEHRQAYNKLDQQNRVMVRGACVQLIQPTTTALPGVCKLALTDKSIPPLFAETGGAASMGQTSAGNGSLANF